MPGQVPGEFSPEAEKYVRDYIGQMSSIVQSSACIMKLMVRAIYQQVILRESGLSQRPEAYLVELTDVRAFKWDVKKWKIVF